MDTVANFKTYSRYYDAFYNDKPYGEEAACVADLIHNHQPAATNVLELGCGTGNHAVFLAESGFAVTGLERSGEMVALAKAKAIRSFEPVVGDIRAFSLGKAFDAAVALFHVISYLTLNRELISCFRCVNDHLNAGGLFIFDAWYSPAVHHQQPATRVKRRAVDGLEITRLAEPVLRVNANTVDVNYEVLLRNTATRHTEVVREQHLMRHFSIPEIDMLAEMTGFETISVQDLLSGEQPGTHTWGVCFVLKKKA